MMNERLRVLVVGADCHSKESLVRELESSERVAEVQVGYSLRDMATLDTESGVNIVFIDPFEHSLDDASREIFSARLRVPSVVFVLFVDPNEVEAHRADFFAGERRRFLHYYRLDRTLPANALAPNVEVALELSVYDIEWQLSKDGIEQLKLEVGRISDHLTTDVAQRMLAELGVRMSSLRKRGSAAWTKEHERTVFVSYSFEETEYGEGLMAVLEEHKFQVVTGDNTNTFISEAIRSRIEDSSLFVSLMTKRHKLADGTYLPSLWLVEEKALAIAALKPMALMVERGVAQIGGLQSDYQRIEFEARGFTIAALKVVRQLESYLGAADN